MSARSTARTLFVCLFVCSVPLVAEASCPAANPYDYAPDDVALQACLDAGGTVTLVGSSSSAVKYFIANGLHLTQSWSTLTATGGRATIEATNSLAAPILRVDPGVNNYTISNIIFHGNKNNRAYAGYVDCTGYRDDKASNVRLFGSGFFFENNWSMHALCGSALTVEGSDFFIRNNWIVSNGFPAGYPGMEPWADGITVHDCEDGVIAHNDVDNNTDIGIVIGGGRNCRIEWNKIRQTYTYAFGGLHIGWFEGGDGDHDTNTYQFNEITSEYDLLGGALVVGFHPWDKNRTLAHAGVSQQNQTWGAVVNLLVDGIDAGTVQMNTFGNFRGTKGLAGCSLPADYTVSVGEIGTASLQGGWLQRYYHGNGCNY